MSYSNSSSGHIFKNSVGRKEKLRYLKHLAPNLCPPGVYSWGCVVCQFVYASKYY